MERPEKPTPALVSEYVHKFDSGPNGVADRELSKLFRAFPENVEYYPVKFKVLALNDVYKTGIIAVTLVVEHILQLNIDPKLAQRAPELVNEITPTPDKAGKIRRNYSFATKYCSWHVPDAYPIYDSFVGKLVYEYRQDEKYCDFFRQNELSSDYLKFKGVIESFRNHFGLTKFGFKDLDKFLWLYGKEYSASPQ
jgi:hypothetical protein